MKFLHTSDWHIGRQLHNQSLIDDQAFALDCIVDLAIEHDVDAVVVAGDIYDRAIPPVQAVELLNRILNRLVTELGIPVLMIAGNHDSHARLGFAASHMSSNGLYIQGPLTQKIEPIIINAKDGVSAAFFLVPYTEPLVLKNLYKEEEQGNESVEHITSHQDAMQFILDGIKSHDVSNLPTVVVSHCFIDGGEESESERPLSMGGADRISPTLFSDFAYTALGHLHGPQFKGSNNIRYSGSLLKYSFSEVRQKKSVTLVSLDQQGQADISLLALKPRRDARIIEGFLDQIVIAAANDTNPQDYIMVRLLDKHAILDPISKLRAVYPNILHLERTGLMSERDHVALDPAQLQQSEMDMFRSFFEQVTGDELNDAQQKVATQVLEELRKEAST